MKTEQEIRERLKLIEDCTRFGYILRLKAQTPLESLEAFSDLLRWVLDEDQNSEVNPNCPECDGPATHPSGLCRDCYQGKLESEEI